MMHHAACQLLIALICLSSLPAEAALLPWLEEEDSFRPYEITVVDGTLSENLHSLLNDALEKNREQLSNSEVELATRNIIRVERDIIKRGLESQGYYNAKIDYERGEEQITYRIILGEQYTVRRISIELPEGIDAPEKSELEIREGDALLADAVLKSEERIRKHIQKNYCLYRVETDYKATVFHETQEAEVAFSVQPSKEAEFGDVKITGADTVETSYINLKLAFEKGDCFKRNKVEQSRLQLFQTGLFGSVDSETRLTEAGTVDTIFNVTERKHRTVKAGGGYSSDKGLGVSAGWEHRNFFGEAEKLEIDAEFSQINYLLGGKLSIPAFRGDPKQTLSITGGLTQDNPDPYDATSIGVGVSLKRQLTPKISGSVGSALKVSSVTDANGEDTYSLLSFPVTLSYDDRNDVLNPTRGIYVSGEVQPFFDMLEQESNFLRTSATAITYYTLEEMQYKPTFAVRGRVGSIQGVSTDDIPADERYYAGGGGSVRGYPYQKLGPLSPDLIPTGGRSIAELSLETRLRFSEDWGGVVFIDGGNAYRDAIPEFGKGLRWGAGLGARYYTSFAPIRLDLAFPLERRNAIDDAFQLYISIGQAF